MKSMTMRCFKRTLEVGTAALLMGAIATPAIAAPARKPVRSAPQAASQDAGVILMSAGASRVVNLPGEMSDVIIADPAIADVHVRSPRQLYIIAKAAGQTDVTVTSEGGKILYHATVRVGTNIGSVDQMLRLAMPDADVTVTTLNGLVLLTGTVASPEDAAEAERLVAAFTGDPDNKKNSVVTRLRTATPLTVNLQVRIAEVSKTLGKDIGMNFVTSDSTSGFKFGVGQGREIIGTQWVPGGPQLGVGNGIVPTGAGSAITAISNGTTLGAAGKLLGLDVLSALDLAENQGLATTLATPNLTALSGETASFLAGGEVPIPLSSSLGQVSIEYKEYGVSLAFTPTVLADGRISMRVRPEVSQLDYSNGIKTNTVAVPGISTRRAETTIELGSGQSFVIGGLLSSNSSNSIQKAPFLGDIPILGNLFKSSSFRRQETELIIVVTPYLVKPVNARDIHLPTDGLRNANDVQRLGGRLHDGETGGQRPVPTKAPPQTVTPDAIPALNNAPPAKPAAAKSGKGAAPGFSF
jgi:pilus assembly protein CpaC